MEMARKVEMSNLLPFLNCWHTLPPIHTAGKSPLFKTKLKIIVTDVAKIRGQSLN